MIKSKYYRGFTLIELLIVVAIIGILAAIAIPNFLQAQVRAKVAHAQSEMGSLNIALEAYGLDFNGYPNARSGPQQIVRCAGWWPINSSRLYVLTTPIEYISKIPLDPFQIAPDPSAPNYCSDDGGYDYVDRGALKSINMSFGVCNGIDKKEIMWRLVSFGPDGNFSGPSGGGNISLMGDYDPSNGTVSAGNIYRYGPGNIQSIGMVEGCQF